MTDWRPGIVALDIDGTLLAWADDGGDYGRVADPVREAVRGAQEAGALIVLASGRSPAGMMPIVDQLELHREGGEPAWVVSSNGAVVFRYPPLDVVHEETFDASRAVREILRHRPEAIVAIEERGVGYRVSREFPPGELSGRLTIAHVEELIAEPVSRVIIRDPSASAEDFLELGRRLGLHGTDYVVGWTAWLDLSPVGVSKALGLAYVADAVGVAQQDVLAIGDGRNDREMLEWAGRGVAMGQAVAEVQEVADAVTASVDDDGAAVELRRWFR